MCLGTFWKEGHSVAPPTPTTDLEPFIGVRELAVYVGVPEQTIYSWKARGKAPPAYRVGKYLKFRVSDIEEWLERLREEETIGPGAEK